mmetsp:Transcript_23591/g.27331  ORF Transcript_23591/g.27331 Transcript_23591/m.27331 type:complete len:475 (-) Transcript_23591:347-1771(-)
MFRKIPLFGGKSKKNRPKKKRLSPTAHERTSNGDGGTTPPPSYQYAMNEYALTGPPITARRSANSPINVDDDGRIQPSYSMTEMEDEDEFKQQDKIPQDQLHQQQQIPPVDDSTPHDEAISSTSNVQRHQHSTTPPPPPPPGQPSRRDGILRSSSWRSQRDKHQPQAQSTPYSPYNRRRYLSPKADYFSYDEDDTITTMGGNDDDGSIGGPSMLKQPSFNQNSSSGGDYDKSDVEPMMPDSTYEEWYGDAYVGGPIRYIYPSGYQSMRPRGGPWKLSIVVCLLFTWLSVFVIGHCSDNYIQNQAAQNNNNNDYSYSIDDDNFVIDAKWCGSRLLYWLWVISMLITGLATAYCGVIGYIKIRDFAVANTRSQPPGIMTVGDYSLSSGGNVYVNSSQRHGTQGNSDYYVPIGEANNSMNSREQHLSALNNNSNTARLQQTHPAQYNKTIYQADGTPQFWGNQIYRPTQAAVAITSR